MRVVTVLGSGKWGAAFGKAIVQQRRGRANRLSLVFWARNEKSAQQAAADAGGRACGNFNAALKTADLVVVAVSSGAFTEILRGIAAVTAAPVAWLTKGFDPRTQQPLPTAAAAALGAAGRYAAISGPSFAAEVSAGKPTALTVAANHWHDAVEICDTLHNERLRLYPEKDIIAVSIAGAVKNVIAVAAGAGDAMQLGENARAAVITRGLAEMALLCRALGGHEKSLLGLSGVGDLTLTCSSDLSRNRRLGLLLGARPDKVFTQKELRQQLPETCESITTAESVLHWINHHHLDAPIIRATAAVLLGQRSPAQALDSLLARQPRRD